MCGKKEKSGIYVETTTGNHATNPLSGILGNCYSKSLPDSSNVIFFMGTLERFDKCLESIPMNILDVYNNIESLKLGLNYKG